MVLAVKRRRNNLWIYRYKVNLTCWKAIYIVMNLVECSIDKSNMVHTLSDQNANFKVLLKMCRHVLFPCCELFAGWHIFVVVHKSMWVINMWGGINMWVYFLIFIVGRSNFSTFLKIYNTYVQIYTPSGL